MKINIVYKKEKELIKTIKSNGCVFVRHGVVIMTGIRILNQEKACLSQGILKQKIALLNE